MPLCFRLIGRLDIRNDQVVSRIRFEGVRRVGDPARRIHDLNEAGIDELYFNDAVASLYGRNSLEEIVRHATEEAFCPVTVGGAIRSVEDAMASFRAGADKVAVNSAACIRPGLIDDLSRKYGNQAVVLQLDAKAHSHGWRAYCEGGRQDTGRDAVEWATEAVGRGAGEVLVTSIDNEGTRKGFDIPLIEALADLPVPIVASGGFNHPSDAVKAHQAGASGIAIAGALHHERVTLDEIRTELKQAGINVR